MSNKRKIVQIAVIFLVFATIIGVIITGLLRYNQEAYTDPEHIRGTDLYETGLDEDPDKDGLTNAEEKRYGTNISNFDTDGDGLTDFYEVSESKTNPLKTDSDNDGLEDRAELLAGLDPNNKKSDGKTQDKKRVFEVVRSDKRVKLKVSGNANVYNVYAGIFNTVGLKNMPGLVCDVYEFYLETPFKNAEVTFNYTDKELKSLGIKENNLSIFQFTNDGEFEAVNSVIDTENNTVTAKLQHFSRYTLGDGTVINADMGIQVMMLIDNSASMYSKEVFAYSAESDVSFKRIDMAKALIDYAGDSIQFGAAKFTGTYTLLSEMGTNNDTITTQLEKIRTAEETFDGTYIANSIGSALAQFKEDDYQNKKYLVLLTDGRTSEGGLFDFTGYYDSSAIRDSINKQVSVIIVGLGNYVDVDYLKNIADKTGGIYLHASNSDALDSIYKIIYSQLNYAFVDYNDDGDNDAVVVSDSGFVPNRNGFSFKNYPVVYDGKLTGGQCFGFAAFAQCLYRNKVPATGEAFDAKLGGILRRIKTKPVHYDLTNTGVLDVANLHDYTNRWLNAYNELNDATSVKDKYYYDDGKLKFTDDFRQNIERIGCKYLITEMVSCDKAKWGGKIFESFESIAFDIDKYLASGEKDPDMDFIVSMYWYYCRQSQNISESEVETRDIYDGTDGNTMIAYVAKGIPLILNNYTAGHAVNITRILRDLDNPKKYYLEIYDNNYKDKLCYYSMEIVDITLWDKTSITSLGEKYSCNLFDEKGKSINASFSVIY